LDTGGRVAIWAGGVAFVLSILTAIFSRISFGTLVLRAVFFGLLFAALGFGVVLFLRRFLPELFEPAHDSDSLVAEPPAGGRLVNIVLPGDADETAEGVEDADDAADGATAFPMAELEEVEPARADSRRQAPLAAAVSPASGTKPSGSGDFSDLAREVGSIRQADLAPDPASATNGRNGSSAVPRPHVSVDDLDVLPDLDGLSDSFAAALPESASDFSDDDTDTDTDVRYSSGSFAGSRSSGGSGGDKEDPAALAKAVQTLLRRDQKG